MIQKKLYKSTTRLGTIPMKVQITEKLDGSNLGIFKVNGKILFAQRNNIFEFDELKDHPDIYGGLLDWANEHHQYLLDNMHELSGVFGEWFTKSGRGNKGFIDYSELGTDNLFHIFAKANYVPETNSIKNLKYDRDLFKYPFKDQIIPEFMSVVPLVEELTEFPSIEYLDRLYDEYTEKTGRVVEGFITIYKDDVSKYVRNKRGKATPHHINFDRKGRPIIEED